jgi:GNAT superfamily N-acetyltransferase
MRQARLAAGGECDVAAEWTIAHVAGGAWAHTNIRLWMTATVHDLPLGLRTDLMVAPAGLSVRPAEGCLILRTPGRDDFQMGNELYLRAPPDTSMLDAWLVRWLHQFAAAPRVSTVVLQWESRLGEPGDVAALGAAAATRGLEFDRNLVMRLERLVPAQARVPMRTRTVASDEDWVAVLAVATTSDMSDGLRAFTAWRQLEYRRLVEAGRGQWWMGEIDGRAVTSAGIFWDEREQLARFQRVDTRPEARGQGCATGLLHAMLADLATRQARLSDVVIVAALGGQGARIYRRLGFEPLAHQDAMLGDRRALAVLAEEP